MPAQLLLQLVVALFHLLARRIAFKLLFVPHHLLHRGLNHASKTPEKATQLRLPLLLKTAKKRVGVNQRQNPIRLRQIYPSARETSFTVNGDRLDVWCDDGQLRVGVGLRNNELPDGRAEGPILLAHGGFFEGPTHHRHLIEEAKSVGTLL